MFLSFIIYISIPQQVLPMNIGPRPLVSHKPEKSSKVPPPASKPADTKDATKTSTDFSKKDTKGENSDTNLKSVN